MSTFFALVRRDIALGIAQRGSIGIALGFYLIVVSMLPFGLGPEGRLLARVAPGMLWIALLLSVLLTLDRIFHADHDDGALEVMMLGSLPLELVALAKALGHWATSCLPLVVLAPVLGLMLSLDAGAYAILVVAMLIGTPALSLIGAAGAALTLDVRRGGLLASLIVLPFYIPTLIFGVGTVSAAMAGTGEHIAPLLMLAAITLVMIVLGPLFAGLALRHKG